MAFDYKIHKIYSRPITFLNYITNDDKNYDCSLEKVVEFINLKDNSIKKLTTEFKASRRHALDVDAFVLSLMNALNIAGLIELNSSPRNAFQLKLNKNGEIVEAVSKMGIKIEKDKITTPDSVGIND